MTLHLCRDFQTLPTASSPGTNMYAAAIFLYHVLGFTFIQHRNFPLQSSSFEKGGGTFADVGSKYLFASTSLGVASGYQVLIPTASYVVSANDVNRILAMQSQKFPLANSGLFRITAVGTGSNTLTIDYRCNSGTFPPPDNNLVWRVYEAETLVSRFWSSGSNLLGLNSGTIASGTLKYGYNTWDAGALQASASRVFLQSPDDSLWQVRLCLESDFDFKSGSANSGLTFAPGYYSSTSPFEKPQGKTLHGPLFYNTTASLYRGTAVGLGPALTSSAGVILGWTSGSWRISMWGDDKTGTFLIINRGNTLQASGWAAFGLPEDDHLYPLIAPDQNTMKRLFTMGSARSLGSMDWRTDFFTPTLTNPPPNNCVVWGDDETPVPGTLSSYADIFNQTTHFRNIAQAGTSSFGGYTEVVDVEILGGLFDTIQTPTTQSLFNRQPRRVGRFPFARQGAGKMPGIPSTVGYVTWSHSPEVPGDPGSGPYWLHTEAGIFLPWGGPALSGSLTGSAVWPISGSIFDEEGVLSFTGNTIGADPDPTPPAVPHDIDATRYRKTYSYFRQAVVATGIIKGGSNKPK